MSRYERLRPLTINNRFLISMIYNYSSDTFHTLPSSNYFYGLADMTALTFFLWLETIL